MSLLDWHPEIILFPVEENLTENWLTIQREIYFNDDQTDIRNIPISSLKFTDLCEKYLQKYFFLLGISDERVKAGNQADVIDYSNIDYHKFITALKSYQQENISIKEWIRLTFQSYQDAITNYKGTDTRYFAFKTTEPRSFTRYCDIFPESNFIHLVRNPYDTFDAFKRNQIINKGRNYFRGSKDLLEEYIEDKMSPLFTNTFTSRMSSDQHYIIKYEDIVLNQRETMSRLCEWLNITWNDNMMVPTLAGKPFLGYSENKAIKHDGIINTQRMNISNQTLSSTEIRIIDYLFYDVMRFLGYTPKYDTSFKNLVCIIFGQFIPFKLELRNWNLSTFITMLSRRFYILHKVIHEYVCRPKTRIKKALQSIPLIRRLV